MLVNREVIAVKIESTYNVDSSPTATDAVLVENLSWSYAGARMIERKPVRQSIAALKQVFAGTLIEISGDVEIKGPGAAYSASVRPEVDAILRACGLGVTVVTTGGSETCTYKPVSTGHESVTVKLYTDGMLMPITGCRGNISGNLKTGETGKFSFKVTGHVGAVTDTALITPTYDTTTPPPVIGGGFTVGGYGAIIDALQWDMNNGIATPPNFNAADGFGEIVITSRDCNGSFDPEAVLVATHDFHGKWRSSNSMALTTGVIGGTQYNRFKVDMPAIAYRSLSPADRDGKRTYSIGYGAAESATDDEISIIFS